MAGSIGRIGDTIINSKLEAISTQVNTQVNSQSYLYPSGGQHETEILVTAGNIGQIMFIAVGETKH